jgi:hypothetical protein
VHAACNMQATCMDRVRTGCDHACCLCFYNRQSLRVGLLDSYRLLVQIFLCLKLN